MEWPDTGCGGATKEQCSNCGFSKEVYEHQTRNLECRKNAPRKINSVGKRVWPKVNNNDWCGDWE